MKIRWIPSNWRGNFYGQVSSDVTGTISTSPVGTSLSTQICCLDIDTYNPSNYTTAQIAALDRSWCRDPTRQWSKYFSAKTLSRTQQCKWQDCRGYIPGQANGLTNASVGFIQPF